MERGVKRYRSEDEEDDRFFHSGLTEAQENILNILNAAESNETAVALPESKSPEDVRRFTRHQLKEFSQNFAKEASSIDITDPAEKADLQFDLCLSVVRLKALAEVSDVSFPLVTEDHCNNLCDLLLHSNSDVASSVVSLLEEWSSEDVFEADAAFESQVKYALARSNATKQLISRLVDAGLVDKIAFFLESTNCTDERESDGFYRALSVLDNVRELLPSALYDSSSGDKKKIVSILFEKSLALENKGDETFPTFPSKSQSQSMELLAEMFTSGKFSNCIIEYVEALISLVEKSFAHWNHSDESKEFFRNIFFIFASAYTEESVAKAYLDAHLYRRIVSVLRKRKSLFHSVLHLLSLTMVPDSHGYGYEAAETFVKNDGVTPLAASLLSSKLYIETLQVMAALFGLIETDSEAFIGLIKPFVIDEYRLVDALFDIWNSAGASNNDEQSELTSYVARIVAWLVMEDDGIYEHVLMLLSRTGTTVKEKLLPVLQKIEAEQEGQFAIPVEGLFDGNAFLMDRHHCVAESSQEIIEGLSAYVQHLK